MVMGDQDRPELIGELLDVEVVTEVAFLDRDAGRASDRIAQILKMTDQTGSNATLTIVEFGARSDEWAAPTELVGLPLEPAREELFDSR